MEEQMDVGVLSLLFDILLCVSLNTRWIFYPQHEIWQIAVKAWKNHPCWIAQPWITLLPFIDSLSLDLGIVINCIWLHYFNKSEIIHKARDYHGSVHKLESRLRQSAWIKHVGASGQMDRALDSPRSEGLGFRFPVLVTSRSVGPTSYSTLSHSTYGYLVHRSKVWSIVACYINTHHAREKGKPEHVWSWMSGLENWYLYPLPWCLSPIS